MAPPGLVKPTTFRRKMAAVLRQHHRAPRKRGGHHHYMPGLQSLRFLAQLQLIGYQAYRKTGHVWADDFNRWGDAALAFFFVLSGFLLVHSYAHDFSAAAAVSEGGGQRGRAHVSLFLARRWAKLYPLYLTSILAGVMVHAATTGLTTVPLALYLVLMFCLSAFIPSARINTINTPGWTVGVFFALYSATPYTLRFFKDLAPSFRQSALPILLFLSTTLGPALEGGLDAGVMTPLLHLWSLTSMGNFLLGINLGLLYLTHESSRHPPLFLRFGATVGVSLILLTALLLPAEAMPLFIQRWRAHGLFAPLYCLIIWYVAQGQDVICPFLNNPVMVFLGDISYAMYLFQQVVFDSLKMNSQYYVSSGSLPSWYYLGWLLVTATAGHIFIQKPYFTWCAKVAYSFLGEGVTCGQHMAHSYGMRWDSSCVAPTLAATAFITLSIIYTNLTCLTRGGTALDSRVWFNAQDFRWLFADWTIPCSPAHTQASPMVLCLGLVAVFSSYLAIPAFMAAYYSLFIASFRSSTPITHDKPPCPESEDEVNRQTLEDEEDGISLSKPSRMVVRVYVAEDYPKHLAVESAVRTVEAVREAMAAGMIPADPVVELVGMDSLMGAEVMKLSRLLESRVKVSLCCMYDVKHQSLDGLIGLARTKSGALPGDVVVQIDGGSSALCVLPTLLDHRDATLSTLFSAGDLNPLGPRSRGLHRCVVISHEDTQRTVPAREVVEALAFGRVPVSWQPGKTCPVEGIVHTEQSLVAYYWQRLRMVLDVRSRGHGAGAITHLILWSEVCMHLAYILCTLYFLTSSRHNCPAWPSLLSCYDDAGLSIPTARFFLTVVTALYSGMFVWSFLRTAHLSDGLLRFVTLLSLLLLVLPLVSLLETYVILCCWAQTRWQTAPATPTPRATASGRGAIKLPLPAYPKVEPQQ